MRAYIRKNYLSILTVNLVNLVVPYAIGLYYLFILHVDPRKSPPPPLVIYTIPIYIVSLIALYFLIFSKSIRDEYMEKIWQRSMRSFAVIIFVIPWIWMIAWLIHAVFFRDDYWLLKDPNQFLFDFHGDNPKNISQLQKSGVDFALGQLMDISPIVFVLLFRWHVWRDRD